jgi:hypothetical protein
VNRGLHSKLTNLTGQNQLANYLREPEQTIDYNSILKGRDFLRYGSSQNLHKYVRRDQSDIKIG